MDRNKDGTLTYEEFAEGCKNAPAISQVNCAGSIRLCHPNLNNYSVLTRSSEPWTRTMTISSLLKSFPKAANGILPSYR